jgi:hypothetical protein
VKLRRLSSLAVLTAITGCAYTQNALREQGETRYPESVEEERERKLDRENWSAIAGPLEIIGGAALVFLSVKSFGGPVNVLDPPPPMNSVIKDPKLSAFVGTLMAVVGTVLVAGGTADLLAGTLGRAFESPFILADERGEPRLIAIKGIDKASAELSPEPQIDANTSAAVNERGVEVRAGFGVFHWPANAVRLRYGLELFSGSPIFRSNATGYAGIALPIYLDWNVVDRYEYGRYPKGALTIFFAPVLFSSTSDFSLLSGYRTGAGLTYKTTSLLVGISHLPSIDSRPQIEVTLASHFITN